MEFEKVLENRKTVREYTNKKIPSSTVDELLNAAIRVPVGMHNDEGYAIVSISDEKILKSITEESIKSGAKKRSFIWGSACNNRLQNRKSDRKSG
ncbi:nitroreductase family protein [Dialister micraerophilus]|uniref:Nitroreductase domain-containing protein n=1 Tax=Dialister micraerophilus UPII 345-E TaxID=910314 RepID=E4L7A0_9FIRM|nr:nitroreductase family protein [Dialister micraerophilus]EFR43424.1 hypothetical protein HMPREF9220_1248 [Dialister micraerophilus UPII 345-E]